jgi:hypothetical protein
VPVVVDVVAAAVGAIAAGTPLSVLLEVPRPLVGIPAKILCQCIGVCIPVERIVPYDSM